MKKKISFLILLLVFSSFFLLYKKKVDGASSSIVDPEEKYGFKISIISYDGKGNPEVKGKPILVYESGLLNDKQTIVHGNYPTASGEAGYQQFIKGSYDVSQFVKKDAIVVSINDKTATSDEDKAEMKNGNNNKEDVSARTKENAETNASGDSGRTMYGVVKSTDSSPSDVIEAVFITDGEVSLDTETDAHVRNRQTKQVLAGVLKEYKKNYNIVNDDSGKYSEAQKEKAKARNDALAEGFYDDYGQEINLTYEQLAAVEMQDGYDNVYYELEYASETGCPTSVKRKTSGEAKSTTKTFRYNSSASKTLFSKNKIANLNEFYGLYEEKEIGTAEDVAKKYAKTSVEIKKYFGLDINPMEMKNIYVQVEVVQRKLEYDQSKYTVVGSFLAASYKHIEVEATKWTTSSSDWSSSKKCPSGTQVSEGGVSVAECTRTEVTACYNLTSKKTTVGYNDSCPTGYVQTTTPKTDSTTVRYDEDCPEGYVPNGGSYPDKKCTYYPDKECTKKNDVTPETLYCLKNCKGGVVRNYYVYGIVSIAPSYIVTTRDNKASLKFNFEDKARNSCSDNKHAILDGNDKATGKYEYYIGPNIENALVGPKTTNQAISTLKNKTYKYTLNDATWDGKDYFCDTKKTPQLGIQHFYFLKYYVCNAECEKITKDKSSDEYLKCVEQYAENSVDVDLYNTRGNARKKKQEVIFEQCGYTYGQSPNTGSKTASDRESKNSCNNSASKYIKGVAYEYNGQSKIINGTSSCNVLNGSLAQWEKATSITPCVGDLVTDFDGSDLTDDPKAFDHRSYINVVCKDTTGFEFKDTSNLKLSKGGGFTYPVKQEGERECTYFFNLEQWKVDYAVSPARTGKFKSDERTRLECILNRFNAASSNETVNCTFADKESDNALYGKTGFESQFFNYGDTSVNAKVDEKLKTSEKNKKENLNLKRTKQNGTSPRLQVIDNETITRVANGKVEKNALKVNRYMSIDEGNTLYELDKVCISTDGLATISKAPDNGICSQTKVNKNTINVLGERKYYTSFQIDDNSNSNIYTTVTVGKDSNKYYTNNENCVYHVSPYSCTLTVRDTTGIEKLGDGHYLARELLIDMHYQIDNSLISSSFIIDNGNQINETSTYIKNKSVNAVEVHNLEGKVKLKSGEEVSCALTVEIETPTTCPVKCDIRQVNDKVYKIISTGSKTPTDFYTYTSNHITPTKNEILKSSIYPFMKKVVGSVKDGERYIRLSSPLEEGEAIYGLVTYSSPYCSNICKYIPVPKVRPNCQAQYDPFDYNGISAYCAVPENVERDVNGYEDSDDCFDKCSQANGCPTNCSDEKAITNYCEDAEKWGFTGDDPKAICINKCTCKEISDDYGFRSINIYNPFPNSQVSQAPYEKGDRRIGKNWIALSDYITNDSNDTTSVTGDNKNTKVEYIIDLSPGDIRKVRDEIRGKLDDTASVQNKRKVYAQLTRVSSSSSKIIEAYKSEFLNSRFAYLFEKDHGDIKATFKPNSQE